MKMFGKLTRETDEWVPARILCVRYWLMPGQMNCLISPDPIPQLLRISIRFDFDLKFDSIRSSK